MNKLMYSFGKLMYSFQPIDDLKISGLLYLRPENSNFQNGGFLYDFSPYAILTITKAKPFIFLEA